MNLNVWKIIYIESWPVVMAEINKISAYILST